MLEREFDDIIDSLHTQKVTTSIVPFDQISLFIKKSHGLKDTLYSRYPYLVYRHGKAQFDVSRTYNGFLRGVIILPIIRKHENALLNFMVKDIDNSIKIFGPVYTA